MKLFSDACEYGLRAVVWMARRPRQPYKVRDIAEQTRATPGYLIKVMQMLAREGILSAQRGSHGGFQLERDPADLTVLDVINAIDPIERITICPLGIESHGTHLCPMHRRIDDALATIERSFFDVTIADLLQDSSDDQATCNALINCSVDKDTAPES